MTGRPPRPLADGEPRRTPRGLRTRARLIESAAALFARDGFLEARITDISEAAGVAHGTFYTYFDSKESIFKEVVFALQQNMAAGLEPATPTPTDPWEQVEQSNRRYIEAYRRNARLMATLEQVATFNDDVRQLRLELRERFVVRNSRAIARWQEQGIADQNLHPEYAANALGTMVDRFAYTWFVLGEGFDEDTAVETLTRLWIQSLGIAHDRDSRPALNARTPH